MRKQLDILHICCSYLIILLTQILALASINILEYGSSGASAVHQRLGEIHGWCEQYVFEPNEVRAVGHGLR